MRTIFDNFLHLHAQNVEPVVLWILGGIYVLLVATSLLSVLTRSCGWFFKLGWSLAVLVLPFVGMALYAIACLWAADRSLLNQLGFSTKRSANWSTPKSLSIQATPK